MNWKKELITNLKNPKFNKSINVYFIPLEWRDIEKLNIDKNLEDEINIFNNKISNDEGKSIIPSSEFLVIKENYNIKNIPALTKKAQYATNKLVVDLENDNYYFYYLDNNDNICEGYIEAKNTIDDDFVVAFNDNSMEKFISSFLSKFNSRKSNNLIIYNLSY